MIARILFWSAIVVIVGSLASLFMLRNLTHDADMWHVDPLTAPTPDSPNSYRVVPVLEGFDPLTAERIDREAPIYDANPALISQAFDEYVLRQPRVQRIAGTPESGWMTYVQTSERLAFPDYISVIFFDLGEGRSTLAIFSRSRIGQSDLGVNKARIDSWLEPLASFEAE